jgi:GWxTD domain-containing protein
MTTLSLLVHSPLGKTLGWTLFHSLWEGAAVALILGAALCVLRSSRARYAVACLAMLGVLAGFCYTFVQMMPEGPDKLTTIIRPGSHAPSDESQHPRPLPANSRAGDILPWLAPFWIAGVILFHLHTLASWMAARRLRNRGVCCAPERWQQRLSVLRGRVRLSTPVALLESSLAGVPVVVGYLRPVILVPVGMLTGMPAQQIEVILLHELAHVRRRDYLVNLMQTVVEGFLFYHPAIWWISGVIRTERENCCDDLVVALSGEPREYAAALAALEQTRWDSYDTGHDAVLAATGGNLMKRIRRLLYPLEAPRTALSPVLSAVILTFTAALALTAWQATPQENSENSPYFKWLTEDVVYIITPQESAAFKNLVTDEEREHFIVQFWLRRDPTPDTVENEAKEEHYRRIAYANDHFASGIPGWKTDRGRIYILYGPADEIESHPKGGKYQRPAAQGGDEVRTYPFELWLYHHIDGVGDNVIIEFVDSTGSGDFHMTTDPHEKVVPR